MIGRSKERRMLEEARDSEYSEFVAVYGRRRVGKTFLVRETFDYTFTFPGIIGRFSFCGHMGGTCL